MDPLNVPPYVKDTAHAEEETHIKKTSPAIFTNLSSLSTGEASKESSLPLLDKEHFSQLAIDVRRKRQLLMDLDAMVFKGSKDDNFRSPKCVDSVGSLAIQVIDDTALVVPLTAPECTQKIDDGKKTKAAGQNGRHKKGQETTMAGENSASRRYSRTEMESLRFVNVVGQRKTWKGIYSSFEGSVKKGYDGLASSKNRKHILVNVDQKKTNLVEKNATGILGPSAGWRRWGDLNVPVVH